MLTSNHHLCHLFLCPVLDARSALVIATKCSIICLSVTFSNSLIVHEEKTKEIITVKEIWICNPNYHKIRWTFALNFSKSYSCFEKLYQTLERVFHQISKHFEVGSKNSAAPHFFNPLLGVYFLNLTLGARSQKSRKLFGLVKPFVKHRPVLLYKAGLFIFCKGNKN